MPLDKRWARAARLEFDGVDDFPHMIPGRSTPGPHGPKEDPQMLSSAHSSSSQNIPVSLFADPKFRRDLAADPVATLAAHGIKVRKSDLPAEIRLPNLDDLGRMSSAPGNGNGPPANPPGNGGGSPSDDFGPHIVPWSIFI